MDHIDDDNGGRNFLNDLNKGVFTTIQRDVRKLDGGEQILQRATDAQAESVAVAVRLIFTLAFVFALLCLLFALMIKELPLRRTVRSSPAAVRAEGEPDPALREPDPAVVH